MSRNCSLSKISAGPQGRPARHPRKLCRCCGLTEIDALAGLASAITKALAGLIWAEASAARLRVPEARRRFPSAESDVWVGSATDMTYQTAPAESESHCHELHADMVEGPQDILDRMI